MKEIWDICEEAGYDCDSIQEDKWDDAQDDFEQECDMWLDDYIEEEKQIIAFEFASRLGLEKKESSTSQGGEQRK